MVENDKKIAMVMSGCRGWCSHHNTDKWADTNPQDRWMPATVWPIAGAWLCYHIWESYRFNGDDKLLRRMFPILRGSVMFLIDFLVEDASGKYLIANPSLSPKNTFLGANKTKGVLCNRYTDAYIDAARTLDITDDEVSIPLVQKCRDRLPPMLIGSLGQLQEWQQDYEEFEPGHRYPSQLWALRSGNAITKSRTPELATASAVVLRRRAEHGGGLTGWSRAWLINSPCSPRKILKDALSISTAYFEAQLCQICLIITSVPNRG